MDLLSSIRKAGPHGLSEVPKATSAVLRMSPKEGTGFQTVEVTQPPPWGLPWRRGTGLTKMNPRRGLRPTPAPTQPRRKRWLGPCQREAPRIPGGRKWGKESECEAFRKAEGKRVELGQYVY